MTFSRAFLSGLCWKQSVRNEKRTGRRRGRTPGEHSKGKTPVQKHLCSQHEKASAAPCLAVSGWLWRAKKAQCNWRHLFWFSFFSVISDYRYMAQECKWPFWSKEWNCKARGVLVAGPWPHQLTSSQSIPNARRGGGGGLRQWLQTRAKKRGMCACALSLSRSLSLSLWNFPYSNKRKLML